MISIPKGITVMGDFELTGLVLPEKKLRQLVRKKQVTTEWFLKVMAKVMDGAAKGKMPKVHAPDENVRELLTAIGRCIKRGERAKARDTAFIAAAIAYGETPRGLSDVIECLRNEHGLESDKRIMLEVRRRDKGSK